LVISNDCSPDNTDLIVKNIAGTHPSGKRIRYLKNEINLGMVQNFISVIDHCKSRYIAICDGDDYWTDPFKLQKQVDFLNANPDFVLNFHDAKMIDEAGDLISASMLPESEKKDFSEEEGKRVRWIPTLTICYRNVLRNFPPEFLQVVNLDTFLFSLLAANGRGKYMEDIGPAVYRIHSGGIWSAQNAEAKRISHIDTYKKMSAYYYRVGDAVFGDYYHQVVANGLERMLAIASEGNDLKTFRNAYFKYLLTGKAYLRATKCIYLQKVLVKFFIKKIFA